tara:strand:- start:689 stop:886 length:198 start_codon:yes stop_codon:yes gene_type:complete
MEAPSTGVIRKNLQGADDEDTGFIQKMQALTLTKIEEHLWWIALGVKIGLFFMALSLVIGLINFL